MSLPSGRNPGSARLLEAAAQIAEARGAGLTVLAPPEVAGAAGFAAWIAEVLAAYSLRLQIEIAPAEPAVLDRRIVELDCRLLAIDAGGTDGITARPRACSEKFACDILVVR